MPMLKSILDQTVKVNQIVLNLPEDNYNIPKEYNDILTVLAPQMYRSRHPSPLNLLLSPSHTAGRDLNGHSEYGSRPRRRSVSGWPRPGLGTQTVTTPAEFKAFDFHCQPI